jgi:2-hydroxychromene-2-carboxylate isomerase
MSKTIDFYWDFGSPASYLAYTQLPRIAREAGAELASHPVLLGGVFQATGNRSPVEVPAKGRWILADLQRFARRYGVPFRMNPHFPVNTLTLMRGAVGLQLRGDARFDDYVSAVFRALWVDGRALGDAAEVAQVVDSIGIAPAEFAALVADPAVKEALKQRTQAAVERGMFGAPTMFVGDEMFWGQDRLDFVAEALRATPSAR